MRLGEADIVHSGVFIRPVYRYPLYLGCSHFHRDTGTSRFNPPVVIRSPSVGGFLDSDIVVRPSRRVWPPVISSDILAAAA